MDSWRAQQSHVHQDPGERNSDPTGDLPGCPGVSSEGMGQWWPDAGLGAWTVAVHAWDLLREVTIIFITSTIVWPEVATHSSVLAWGIPGMAEPGGLLPVGLHRVGHD